MTTLKTSLAAAFVALGLLAAPSAKADSLTLGFSFGDDATAFAVSEHRGRGGRGGGPVVEEDAGEDVVVEPRGRGWDRDRGGRGEVEIARWLSPREVRVLLRDRGFHRIRFLDNEGRRYRAFAISPRGREVILTVSSRTGEILDIERAGGRRW